MKFNDLSKEQQQVLTAWMNGEMVQYYVHGDEWIDIRTFADIHIAVVYKWALRVKPKEPMITQTFSPVFKDGAHSYSHYGSIREIWQNIDDKLIHSFILKTYHDGVFVGARIVPKLELNLKGLA